jgi:hypothetical protein
VGGQTQHWVAEDVSPLERCWTLATRGQGLLTLSRPADINQSNVPRGTSSTGAAVVAVAVFPAVSVAVTVRWNVPGARPSNLETGS